VAENPNKEMEYKFFSAEEFEKLAEENKIRGKDVVKLARDFFGGRIKKYELEPEIF
jgi:hypothetical protein